MSSVVMSEEQRSALIRDCIETGRDVIAGGTGIVEASRILSSASHALGMNNNPEFLSVIGIDSLSDHFPLGSVRKEWAIAALKREDALRKEFENENREFFLEVCKKIITLLREGAS